MAYVRYFNGLSWAAAWPGGAAAAPHPAPAPKPLPASARNWGAGPDLPIRRARGNLANPRDLGQQSGQTPLHRGQRVRFGWIRKLADRTGFGGDLEGFAGTGDAVIERRFIMGLRIRSRICEFAIHDPLHAAHFRCRVAARGHRVGSYLVAALGPALRKTTLLQKHRLPGCGLAMVENLVGV